MLIYCCSREAHAQRNVQGKCAQKLAEYEAKSLRMIRKQLSPSRCGTSIGCPAKDQYAMGGPPEGPVEPLKHPILYKAIFLAVLMAVSSYNTGL